MYKKLLMLASIFVFVFSALLINACSHTHNYTAQEILPTCTESGYTLYKCKCGEEYMGDVVSSLGHEFGEYVANNDQTCIDNGTETATCLRENCNQTHTREIPGTILGHEFIDYVSNNNAKCASNCTETAICSREGCNEKRTRDIENTALGHIFGDYVVDNNATCTGNSTETATCLRENCGETKSREILNTALGHEFVVYVFDNNATCLENGTETATCSRDNCNITNTRERVNSALGHDFSNYVSNNDASCTVNATETATCNRDNCNETNSRQVPNSALGHKFTNYISNNDATFAADGTETAVCERAGCKETDTRIDEWSMLIPDTLEFISDGVCEYQIVVPEDYEAVMRKNHIKYASKELQRLIEDASGCVLPIVKDNKYVSGKYISLGDTSLVPTEADIDLNKLTLDGIFLFSKEDNIYLLGGSDTAVHYAVYEFLERYFGYDAISSGVEILDNNVKNLTIDGFKFIEEPDVKQRHLDGSHTQSMGYKYRMRGGLRGYSAASGLFTYDNTGKPTETYVVRNQHNSLDYIPYNTHKDLHGAYWYATNANGDLIKTSSGSVGEVCFTAHGDENQYQQMLTAYADILKQTIIQRFVIAEYQAKGQLSWKNSTWNNMSIGIEDYGITCECDACTERTELYGGYKSGLVIRFIKDVADIIYDWFETEEGKNYVIDNFRISFSAYADYADAPAKYDETLNKYVPVHPDVAFNDRIMVNLALSSTYKYTAMLDINDPRNAEGKSNILKWLDLTSNATLWTYNANFGQYLHFTDSFVFYSNDTFKFFADLGVISWHNQNAYNTYPITGFTGLKTYLNSKLMWDNDADIQFYIERYFKAMYGEHSAKMLEIFNKQRQMYQDALSDFIEAGDDWNGFEFYDSRTNLCGYYKDNDLKQLISAYEDILKNLDKNSDLYYRILVESLCPYYTLLTNAKVRVSTNVTNTNYPTMDDSLLEVKDKFKSLVKEVNDHFGELYGDMGLLLVSETGGFLDNDMLWSQLGYRHSPQGARAYSLLIPRIDHEQLKDSGRVNNATKKLTVGKHELDWVFGVHSSPYQLFDYKDIKFEIVSGNDVLKITPNGYVADNNGVIPSSLIYDANIKDSTGNKYTYINPYTNTELTVKRFDYGILDAKTTGTAVLRISYYLDDVYYKFDVTVTVTD